MESYSRVRSVKLKRGSPEQPFGFSVRGGHEHGTGIFVSFVDPHSIAWRQSLKVKYFIFNFFLHICASLARHMSIYPTVCIKLYYPTISSKTKEQNTI